MIPETPTVLSTCHSYGLRYVTNALVLLIGLLSVHNNVLLRSAVGRLPACPCHTPSHCQ